MAMTVTVPVAQETHRARQIVEKLREGVIGLDREWRICECNAAAEAFLDAGRDELIGRPVWDVLHTDESGAFGQIGRRVAATRKAEEAEVIHARRRQRRLLWVQVFPLDEGLGVVWRDITNVRASERRLADSEAKYRELADGTPAAAWLTRPDGRLEFINQAMAEALGRPREALLGLQWQETVDDDDRERLEAVRRDARRRRAPFHYEGRFRRPDNSVRILRLDARPRFDAHGGFRGYAGMAADVTETRIAEKRQKLLIRELNHRVKNTLATVQSLIRHTLRNAETPREVEDLLTERLLALSAAHDVLTKESWVGARLANVAEGALKPYLEMGRIEASGPDVRIAPDVAVALSMALHELCTNAVKHGALSLDAGRVRLHWHRAEDDAVRLEWRETGGPKLTPPRRTGFGSRLLGRALAGELGRPAELVYAPDGLVCRIRVPVVAGDAVLG
jgi:PAS domain S-box-containing protein